MREHKWFYSGDIGVIHKDGYSEVKDQSNDVIIGYYWYKICKVE